MGISPPIYSTMCSHWARTTNTGVLYPNIRNNIGGDIPIDVPPQPKYWRGCVPGIPGGVDASADAGRQALTADMNLVRRNGSVQLLVVSVDVAADR